MSDPVRLTPETLQALIEVLTTYVQNSHAELRLYGSRTDLQRRGGDIDILLIMDNAKWVQQLRELKHYILADIKTLIGCQKIDLLITDNKTIHQDLFLQMITPSSVLLKEWGKSN